MWVIPSDLDRLLACFNLRKFVQENEWRSGRPARLARPAINPRWKLSIVTMLRTKRLRHPHRAGIDRPRGGGHHRDLHACAQPSQTSHQGPGGLKALSPCGDTAPDRCRQLQPTASAKRSGSLGKCLHQRHHLSSAIMACSSTSGICSIFCVRLGRIATSSTGCRHLSQ